jgi:hypothetical protein
MNNKTYKNSLWNLYGIVVLSWVVYILSILINNDRIEFISIVILFSFALLIVISQWSSTVEIQFSEDFMLVRHRFTLQSKKIYYVNIKSVENKFFRVYGTRLIFRCIDDNSFKYVFSFYKPNKEMLEFLKAHISTCKW